MSKRDKYEAVIGLEVHAQLMTASKAYCADGYEYGSAPNTQVSPVSLGHPGTLPRFNERVLEYAVKVGLACKSEIRERNEFARKNYFYADLPKGYQITQDTTPICTGGHVTIDTENGEKHINLTRIHMEEDSGKSVHDIDPFNTLIDLNRAGVPLIEIVSEPDLRSGEEAYAYLQEVRKMVRYLDICDGNMEEGSLRCDANISIRLKGATEYGQRVEVKNMNSMRNVQRAIDHEIDRHVELVEQGIRVDQETRGFDAVGGTTFNMRSKEDANDYRYFPEPDLVPVIVTKEKQQAIADAMPEMPRELFKKYTTTLSLSEYDAQVLIESKEIAQYFENVISSTDNYKAAANWVMGDIKSYLNQNALEIDAFPIVPQQVANLIELVKSDKVSQSVASQKIFPALLASPKKSPEEIATENDWLQSDNSDELAGFVEQALAKYPEKVEEYRGGKKGLMGLFMGEVMKLSRGQANPKMATAALKEKLEG